MKKIKHILITLLCIAIVSTLAAFKKSKISTDNCGEWSENSGISMRECFNSDYKSYSHQFYNGYGFTVHFYVVLTYTDGTESCHSNGCWPNLYLDGGAQSYKAGNDGNGKKKISSWRVTSKKRKDSNGKWIDF